MNVSSKTASLDDGDLFGYFGDDTANSQLPGAGMPASFTDAAEPTGEWRAMPIGPDSNSGTNVDASFDPDCDDAVYMPPKVTMDQQRKALARHAALRPLSSRNFGRNKNIGAAVGIWNMINPPPDRTGANRPKGQVAFGISDSYWSAASCDNAPTGNNISPTTVSSSTSSTSS